MSVQTQHRGGGSASASGLRPGGAGSQPRRPAGTPVGGQFDRTAGAGGAVADLGAWDWATEPAASQPDTAAETGVGNAEPVSPYGHTAIMRDIAARRRIDDEVTGAVTGASLVTDLGNEMFYPKDSSEAFACDSDNLVSWSDDPHRGRDFMEVRVGPHVMYIDPQVDEATGEVRYKSDDGDLAFYESDADEMTDLVGDFLRSEVKDHPARRLEAFRSEGADSREYGTTFDPETAALLVVRDKIDEATLPGTTVDDGTVDSPAGVWDELPVDAVKALRDAEETATYWKEQRLAVWARQNARRDAERLVSQREKMVATCESTLAFHTAMLEQPITEEDLRSGGDRSTGAPVRTPYQVGQERRDAVEKAEKGLATAKRWLASAQEKVAALPEPFKQAYIDDVERGVVESGTVLSKAKRSGNHGASRAEMDLGFTVDSNTLDAEDVLEIRNEYARSKRRAPESITRDELRSLAHDAAITRARVNKASLRADMLADELAERGVPAVVATFKDNAHVPSDLDEATISGNRWNDGWRRLSDGENTFVRFVDSYTEAAEVVKEVASRDRLRARKSGEIVSGQQFHGVDGSLALRGGTTWDVVDETSKVAVTGMGRSNFSSGYGRGDAVTDEGETSWVLDTAAADTARPLF